MSRLLHRLLVATAAVGLVVTTTPSHADDGAVEIVLSGEGNRLNAYDSTTGGKHTVIPSATDDPVAGLDINAEICIVPDEVPWKTDDAIWFIAGEDTEQNSEPGVVRQGWGVFRLTGTTLTDLQAEQVGKFTPDSFVTTSDNPENYGCGVLPDGRVVTSDVGDQLPHEPATGQLIVWFPAAEQMQGPLEAGARNDFPRIGHCKIDVTVGTAGGLEVDGTDVLLASNRPDLEQLEPGGIYRYDTSRWPAGESAAAGCGRTDPTGEPLADEDRVGRSLFIVQPAGVLTPSDIVHSGRRTFYVSSVWSGTVAEYSRDGVFLRNVVTTLGQLGGITPFGLTVTSDGTLWIADIGVVGPGPAQDEGSVVRVVFDDAGNPSSPEVVDEGLQYPDGLGAVVLRAGDA